MSMHANNDDTTNTMIVSPANPDSRWVALDEKNKILSEGTEPLDVISNAQKITTDFCMMFIPVPGNIYVF